MEQGIKDIIKINGERDLVRDKNSKALLSRNYEGLKAYKIQKNQMKQILEYENDINTLKSEITAIRATLDVIVNNIKSRD
jgi:hypothetical protein|tara:strand:- start:1599 stop:1838 length:240 start_codon:yes stop_codon:yes gene_type:complete